jgi:parvulin-like peptidyl-prolyl isomerase
MTRYVCRFCLISFLVIGLTIQSFCQSITQIKKELEATPDPLGYVKNKLKKKVIIDTVTVFSSASFIGVADSIAFKGKLNKVYGPFDNKVLYKVLAKVPNTFYQVSHILIDTPSFSIAFAEKLAGDIITKIKSKEASFADMARAYSNDNLSAGQGGDLGWFIRGAMLPQLDEAVASHKAGEIYTVWTAAGLHVVTSKAAPKKMDGFALLLRVML